MGWLDRQRMLVTGGGSGLGLAMVERFRAEGARVAVLDRDEAKVAALRERGDGTVAVAGDVTSLADNERAVASAVAEFGGLDVFVANAGLWDFATPLLDLPGEALADGFAQLFGVDVLGTILGARAAGPELRRSRGSFLVTLSNAAFHPGGGGVLYTAAKHAGRGIVRQLAYEWAPEVRVNGVAPGGMASDLRGPSALGMADTSFGAAPVKEMMEFMSPLRYGPDPVDYTGHYVLLASRENNRTVTGEVHVCDSGVGVAMRAFNEEMHDRFLERTGVPNA